ncbi:hypothetical protein GOP47_0019995 [Adiantum capillus-veneris]|uniref:procollagen-proline 4-dioxygenase n=1 Tax=Adiantum capillus-veneris TaxID=13818 RepID=A0A9D4UCD4_ADICA|nr:hypothetical protein GOP47_0019995 [Adiantum capillus-veneris]
MDLLSLRVKIEVRRREPETPLQEFRALRYILQFFITGSAMALGFFLLIFLVLGSSIQAMSVDDLPGWMGEINSKKTEAEILSQKAQIIDPTRIIQLAWKPRAFLYKGFLSDKECEHLKQLARNKLEKSMVADNESGKGVLSDIRTSSGMFIDKGHDEVVRRIENRMATWTFLPEENGEALQVLKYEHGEKYEPHYDFFQDNYNIQMGGHRIATVLMYLSNVTKGGETIFPNAPDYRVKDDTWSECAKRGLSVKPIQGDALLFFSLTTEAKTDTSSLHGSCPVVAGEKWSATKWIHVDSFDKQRKAGGCEDENVSCAEWAAMGECEKNPSYMVGSENNPGACRASCRVC